MPLALLALAATLASAADAPLLRIVAVGDTGKPVVAACAAADDPAAARMCAEQDARLHAHLAALSPAPDVILATGDLFYGGPATVAAYRRGLRRFWGKVGVPVLPMRGNHDVGDDIKPATQPKVAGVLAAAFPQPAGSPWARVPCSGGGAGAAGPGDPGDAARLCYAGVVKDVCIVTGDSADPADIRLPAFPDTCAWKIAALHHPPATSYEKKKEIAGVASVLATRRPDVVVAGHAHHQEALVAEVPGAVAPTRMLSVVSGAGSERRFPSEPLTLADGTVAPIAVDATGEGAAGRTPTGLAPAYVYADHGFTVLDVYADHLLLRPILVRGAAVEAAPCWRWDKSAQTLTPASCDGG